PSSQSGAGAPITSTTDGSTPTAASPIYTSPILVTQTTTIKAMAAAGGMANSVVASPTYTIRVPAPTFNPAAGTYTSSVTVTISDSTARAAVYHTAHRSTPPASSPLSSSSTPDARTPTVKP